MPGEAARMMGWAQRMRNTPGPFAAPTSVQRGGMSPVTFGPGTPLRIQTYLALGANLTADPSTWTLTDITTYVRYDPGITATTGRQDESTQVTTGRATLSLDNRDGRFSRKNPNGPYYGQLTRNTPILVTVNAGNITYPAVQMFVNEWPARWDKTQTDFTVPITCAGILRRLGQGVAPTKSLFRRTIEATAPISYWPMEDESGSTSLAEYHGGKAMVWGGNDPTLAVSGPGGSGALPQMGANTIFSGTVAAYTGPSPNTWTAQCVFKSNNLDAGSLSGSLLTVTCTGGDVEFIEIDLDGVNDGINIWYKKVGGARTAGGFIVTNTVFADGKSYGHWSQVSIDIVQSGGNVTINTAFHSPEQTDPTVFYFSTPQTFAGTLGNVSSVSTPDQYGLGQDRSPWHIGHIAVWNSALVLPGLNQLGGYSGETAKARVIRLCSEAGVLLTAAGDCGTLMGAQPIAAFVDLLRECETADGGVLYETGFGLGYQTRQARYNAPTALALSVTAGQVAEDLQPTDDDQRLVNKWTVTRSGGSSATVEDTASETTNGTYASSTTINISADTELTNAAAWLVHVGINDDLRWPVIPLNFARTQARSLIDTWMMLPFGARVSLANLPTNVVADPVDVFIEGKTETFNQFIWTATLNTSPGLVEDVFRIEARASLGPASDVGRFGLVQTLTAGIGTGDTTMQVTTPATGAVMTTSAADFPMDIVVDGERMTVTNVTGSTSPQTVTMTRSVNGVVKTHSAGAAMDVYRPGVISR